MAPAQNLALTPSIVSRIVQRPFSTESREWTGQMLNWDSSEVVYILEIRTPAAVHTCSVSLVLWKDKRREISRLTLSTIWANSQR